MVVSNSNSNKESTSMHELMSTKQCTAPVSPIVHLYNWTTSALMFLILVLMLPIHYLIFHMMLGLQCCQIAVLLIYDEAQKSVTPPLVMSIQSEQEGVTNIYMH